MRITATTANNSLDMVEGENSNKEPNWSMEEIKSADCFKCQMCSDCLGARPKIGKKKQYGGDYEMSYRTRRRLARISEQNFARIYHYQNYF